ncbi:MAG: ABC transporter substrate-binding protein, partial [Chloroflexi bacterium]|nr:ABC transporter substrate-binding protein [Chloroflexota bacterium]
PAATSAPESPATSVPESPDTPVDEGLKSKDPTTLVVATIGEPETLDPALAYETAGGEIIQNVYETLVFYDGEATDKFVPQLAESWEVSEDGTVYTFKMRSGVKFHDGADMTASDAAYSFQRGLLFGGYSGPQWLLAEPFFGIGVDDISIVVDGEGACADDRECLSALPAEDLLAACEKVTGAIVADDAAGTVTMTLAQAWGPFIPTIASGWGSVLDKDWAVANGAWDGSCETWQNFYAEPSETDPLTTIMNGTGPFKLDHWTQGEELVLARNDSYWREPAKLERVVIKSIDEWGTRFAMLQAGDADIAAVPAENRSQVDEMVGSIRIFDLDAGSYAEEVEVCAYDPSQQGSDKFTPCAAGETGTGGSMRLYIGRPAISSQDMFMTFNIAETSNYVGSGQLDGNGIPLDFFSDVHVRKAFAYCFDWDTYISDVFDGEAVQQPVLARQGMPGYEADAPVYTYDPAQCESEFKAADLDKDGIAAGDDPEGDVWTTGFRLQALYNQGNTSRQVISEILSSNIADVNELFVIETVGLPWPTFLRTLRASQAPYFASGWLEDIHDPHNWYQPYMLGTYASRQKLPADLKEQFSDILNRGVAATDSAERQAIYEEANALYYEQVPTILLATTTSHGFDQRWVKGTILNPIFSGNYYYTMYKE